MAPNEIFFTSVRGLFRSGSSCHSFYGVGWNGFYEEDGDGGLVAHEGHLVQLEDLLQEEL